MKILCLHGYGTGPEVLKHQLSGLTREADSSWEFHFLSGEVECPPAPGIENAFPPPYYCWTQSFDAETVDAAHGLIEEAIEEHGPFDGVLGFSQGAAILASFLLEDAAATATAATAAAQDEHGHDAKRRPLFQFAIFCSPTIPCTADPDYTRLVYGTLSNEDQERLQSGQAEQIAQLPDPARAVTEEFITFATAVEPVTRKTASSFFHRSRPLDRLPAALHPDVLPIRLSIPTLQIRGANDIPNMDDFVACIRSFCGGSQCQRTVLHSAGHDFPKSGPEVRQLLSAMESVILQSQSLTQ